MQRVEDITALIGAWHAGDSGARDRLFAATYGELRTLAARVVRAQSAPDTARATAVLNDALIKLIEGGAPLLQSRAHFANVVARAMRQVLIDRARRRHSDKRGGGVADLELEAALEVATADGADLVALDDALSRLAALDPQAAEVVELRVFAGLTIEDVAVVLGISTSAVNREWAHARAWLKEQLLSHG